MADEPSDGCGCALISAIVLAAACFGLVFPLIVWAEPLASLTTKVVLTVLVVPTSIGVAWFLIVVVRDIEQAAKRKAKRNRGAEAAVAAMVLEQAPGDTNSLTSVDQPTDGAHG